MNAKKFAQIKRATAHDKYLMEEIIRNENEFEQQEPHGHDENDNIFPIVYRLENHDGYQMQAYSNEKMMDSSYHQLLCRCGNCGEIFSWGGEDFIYCYHCDTEFSE